MNLSANVRISCVRRSRFAGGSFALPSSSSSSSSSPPLPALRAPPPRLRAPSDFFVPPLVGDPFWPFLPAAPPLLLFLVFFLFPPFLPASESSLSLSRFFLRPFLGVLSSSSSSSSAAAAPFRRLPNRVVFRFGLSSESSSLSASLCASVLSSSSSSLSASLCPSPLSSSSSSSSSPPASSRLFSSSSLLSRSDAESDPLRRPSLSPPAPNPDCCFCSWPGWPFSVPPPPAPPPARPVVCGDAPSSSESNCRFFFWRASSRARRRSSRAATLALSSWSCSSQYFLWPVMIFSSTENRGSSTRTVLATAAVLPPCSNRCCRISSPRLIFALRSFR
eukprot:comp21841_c0_seq1/m.49336 comp21841_c0_seq1/g.49336  ORF comp21841_c0_seq1/g.49336 comp21841_c0_seq1/m.49336 type:complete len:334 (-) comp21841_c0_seq1:513-1514(-)